MGKIAKELVTGGGMVVSCPQDRITWGSELSTGFDRLKFGFHVEWKETQLLEHLIDWKAQAQEQHEPISVTLPGLGPEYAFLVHTSGRKGGYAFHLSAGDVHLFFSTRKDWMATPNLWVDVGSVSCWVPGWKDVYERVEEIVTRFSGVVCKVSLSEVHLCTDFIGTDINTLGINDYDHWVTRANVFHPYYQRTTLSGVELSQTQGALGLSRAVHDIVGSDVVESGLRVGQGDIMLRCYNKVLELKTSGAKQAVFSGVWGKTQYDEQPVTRVEYQLRRPVLRQLGVSSMDDLMVKIGGVWEYCTTRWAVLCAEAPDRINRHQDRAKVHDFWLRVQGVNWGAYQPIKRTRLMPLKDKHQLADQMVGCALNIAALSRCAPELDQIMASILDEVRNWCDTKALEIDPKTKKPVVLAKFLRKQSEIWPHGTEMEVHG